MKRSVGSKLSAPGVAVNERLDRFCHHPALQQRTAHGVGQRRAGIWLSGEEAHKSGINTRITLRPWREVVPRPIVTGVLASLNGSS